jgi:outer membrane receptor protein involved in Fe transport
MIKLSFLLFLLFPLILFSQIGKIVGTVTDASTGEPLAGANIIIEGTSLGTATDLDGNILILNVGPGTYSLRTTYIGYQDQVIENIRVSVNLTTEVNFQLQDEVLDSDAIVIVAEKPLINKNITNSSVIISAEDIEHLPLRSVNAIVSQQAGVVNQNGNLYIRGSRLDQVAFYLDGVLVNDVIWGGPSTSAIKNAIEEIQVQAGGYSAEFGGANGGIISTHSKVGGENYHVNVELITDNFVPVGEEYLGGYSYGQSEHVLTVGGPVIPSYKNLKFFVAANNTFYRSLPRFYIGIDEKGIYDPILAASGTADTFDVYYPEGYKVNSHQNAYMVQGNLTWDLNPVTLRFNGSYRYSEGRNGVTIENYNTRNRAGINESEAITASLKFLQVLTNRSYYDITATYFEAFWVPEMDPKFRHNITAYGDSIENSRIGTLLDGDSRMPVDFDAYGMIFNRREQPYNGYFKERQKAWGIAANFLYQLGKHNEIKLGINYKKYEMRSYYFYWNNPVNIAKNRISVGDGDPREIYTRLRHIGYDIYGNPVDDGPQAPKYPEFAGFYLQDKLEFDDLIINAGLRFDYIFTDDQKFVNPHNIKFIDDYSIDPSTFINVEAFTQVSPRLGFSFPVTEKTIFHAQYGKFFQQSRLRDIYTTYNKADKEASGWVGFGVSPERTTQYEIGFRQQLGNDFAFDITLFYKDIKDQVHRRPIHAEFGASHGLYTAYVNGAFETVKGLELKVDLRRTGRIAGSIDYTFSDASGTGSNAWDLYRVGGDATGEIEFLQQIAPVAYNQVHRGSAILDYQVGRQINL